MNEQKSVKDYGHCILRIWVCIIFICGETWNNYINFGGYIDLNLECLEITEGQLCAIIHWAPGSWRWDYHTFFTLILLMWRIWWANDASKCQMGLNSAFKVLNIAHQMPTTAPHSRRHRTWTCHGICYICEKCALLLEDTCSRYSGMRVSRVALVQTYFEHEWN
jgi:hypothetical protein